MIFRNRSTLLLCSAIFSLLLLAVMSAGCRQTPAVAEEEIRPAPVKAVNARLLAIGQWTELLGTTLPLPDHVARISAPFEGRVLSVLKNEQGQPIHEGQQVKAGTVIAQLDVRLLLPSREAAKAELKNLDEQKQQADYAVQQAELELKQKEGLKALDVKLDRPFELAKARTAFLDAQSKQRGVVATQVAGQAKVKGLTEQIELSTLRAPIEGRLGLLQAVPGQSLAIGATIAEVIDLAEVDVLCFVPPYIARQLADGMPARVKPQGESTGEVPGAAGKIVFIAQQAHPETGNFAVKVRFPNPDLRLRANAVLSVEVQTQPEKERLTVPDTALLEDQDPPGVIVFQDLKIEKTKEGKEEKRGKARLLKATIGVRDRAWHVVEILGLEDPETKEAVSLKDALIVVEGGHGLQTGDVVKIQEEDD